MNPRERLLAIALGAIVVLGGGGFAFYQFYWQPYQQRAARVKTLQGEIDHKNQHIEEVQAKIPQLRAWQHMSLPESPKQDPQRSKRDYEKFLSDLIRRSGIPEPTAKITEKPIEAKTNPSVPGKGPIYTRLAYTINAKASYASLVRFFEGFYRAPLLHEVKTASIKRETGPSAQRTPTGQPDRNELLTVLLNVEALILPGGGIDPLLVESSERNVDRRVLQALAAVQGGASGLWLSTLAAIPSGPALRGVLADPSRDYTALAARDIFRTPPPGFEMIAKPEWTSPRWTFLNHYSSDERRTEFWLYDRASGKTFKNLRPTPGFDYFPFVKDSQAPVPNSVAQGVIVRFDVEQKEVVLRVELTPKDKPDSSRAKDRAGFFRLELEKLDQYKKDKTKIKPEEQDELARDQFIREEYGDRVLRVDRQYWEALEKDEVVRVSGDGTFRIEMTPDWGGAPPAAPVGAPGGIGAFGGFGAPGGLGAAGGRGGAGGGFGAAGGRGGAGGGFGRRGGPAAPSGDGATGGDDLLGGFAAPGGFGGRGGFGGDSKPIELLKGKVIRGPGPDWYVKVDEKYCALHFGESLEDCLKKPLADTRVKELKAASAAGAAPAGGVNVP